MDVMLRAKSLRRCARSKRKNRAADVFVIVREACPRAERRAGIMICEVFTYFMGLARIFHGNFVIYDGAIA